MTQSTTNSPASAAQGARPTSNRPIRIALVGIGKIAQDQHIPALRNDSSYELVAAVGRSRGIEGLPRFADIASLAQSGLAVDAVSFCTPPVGRYAMARAALEAGFHVMLEKPPGATVAEVHDLAERARARGRTLFATWHSRESAAVDPARDWLAQRTIKSVRTDWKEDIRHWHPGQDWILEPGGFGVFDPGINALSIMTTILPERLRVQKATLHFPSNRQAPIAAQIDLVHGTDTPVVVELDFLKTGPQQWDIQVETNDGTLLLREGGRRLFINGEERVSAEDREYPRLYQRFAALVAAGASDVDVTPHQIVADAFMIGRRLEAAAFEF
jgi:Predicted dehydrogenases and related proteins